MKDLEKILKPYYEKYSNDFKKFREVYCGTHCGPEDLKEFELIFNEELNRKE